LIEARNLAEPTDKSKKFFNSQPRQNPRNSVLKPRGPARLRASRVYTDHPLSPQPLNDGFANYLNEPESQNSEARAPNAAAYIECAKGQAGTSQPDQDRRPA